MTADQMWKYGFLQGAADRGYGPEAAEALAELGCALLEKRAYDPLKTLKQLATAAVVVPPVLAFTGGAALGYGAGRSGDKPISPKELRQRELVDYYRQMTHDLRRKQRARNPAPPA